MSVRQNTAASYLSQGYVTAIGIAIVPVYLRFMGAEAYGLIGFFTSLQAWFQLLDVGLTPAISREAARFRSGAVDPASLRRLLRALETIFIAIAILGGLALFLASGAIATRWLRPHHLAASDVALSIEFMAVTVAIRWVGGLYRGVISGFERIVWLSGFTTVVGTIRYLLPIPILIRLGFTPQNFFAYQTMVAAMELMVLVIQTYRLVPGIPAQEVVPTGWKSLRAILGFSVSIAASGSIWVAVTQTDKLLLSRLLPLADYGYYSMAVLVANGVLLVSTPLATAFVPRLTAICAEGDDKRLLSLYRGASQFIAVLVIPIALVLAFLARPIIWAWTGNHLIADSAAPVLGLYALGNAVLALTAFPYYLQFAKGDLKLHVVGHVLFLLALVPLVFWGALTRGAVGAGYAWLATNVAYFVFWTPRVHQRFYRGLHRKWLMEDFGGIAGVCALAIVGLYYFSGTSADRLHAAIETAALAVALMGAAAIGSPWARGQFAALWRTRLQPWK